ncbi:tripartite tricarboxylate transporter substrate binding protein [Roseomonas sp. SSH11]|uniref:Tripartite tricarboxylate transporter substrate binding protein n=1 Tax=Pararoseomonas baculiformis TaxID=2820812 RepID=A0ABS4AG76_9PROT|nr:tripartite tricarboxylate transporter substrate binding protein [Pararoseomonas baculiformis]MBP0446042.1 tripartite tricarboxylate transporter substrate binding protein [Pararoseomonas baculiformis]
MTDLRRRDLAALLSASALPPALARPALAQASWPAKPIRFIVPWPPGGLNDLLARAFNDQVSRILGASVVNDFKAGAGGRIGVAEIARAAPDGYTIGMGNLGPLTIFPNLYSNLPYDARRDLVPVTMFAASPLVLVANKDLPASNVAELVALAKQRPGRMNMASVGVGTPQHLVFEMIKERDGLQMEHVPYHGPNQTLPAIFAGDVHAMFDALPLMLPQIRSGAIKALAVTTPQRVPLLPDVPTLAESGYPEVDVVGWYAVIAPAGTPRPVIERLYTAYTEAAATSEIRKLLQEQALIYLPNTQAGFAERIAAETERWARIIKEQNIRVQ